MESIEEVILALRAAGWDAPEYEILPDGSYYFFHGSKETHSLLNLIQSGDTYVGNRLGNQELSSGNASS